MNANRKLTKILAIAVLTLTVGSVAPALAQGHSSGGGHMSSGGGHMSSGSGHSSFSASSHAHYAVGGSHVAPNYAGGYRGAYHGPRTGYYGGSYWRGGYGGGYWHGGYWGGGYWHGGFYGPRFYGPRFGFGWFLPVLPAFYATYYFGGIPYYYANDAYYTWSPAYNGYVATEPPAAGAADAPADAGTAPPPSGMAADSETYTYPKNGQTAEQQASDRNECQQWASSQSGYDPRANGGAGQQSDYHRALTACLEGRGYSVR